MKKLLLATSLLLSTSAIAAEPLSAMGFNAGMSYNEAVAHAESKGFPCGEQSEDGKVRCTSEKAKEAGHDYSVEITDPEKMDNPVSDWFIEIHCSSYSTCQSGIKPIAQAVVNRNAGLSMKYNMEYIKNPFSGAYMRNPYTNEPLKLETYKGTGRAGDDVEVYKDAIVLIKGQLAETITL